MNFCLPSFFNRQTHFECFREKRANGLDPAGFTVIGLHANLFGKLDLAPFSHMLTCMHFPVNYHMTQHGSQDDHCVKCGFTVINFSL